MQPVQLPPTICVENFLQQANRLGIEVRWAKEGMNQLDAAYYAVPEAPGYIALKDGNPRPSPKQICTLLTHEMVHVLQHWKGDLRAVKPLGWPVDGSPEGRKLSKQEQEAYTAQSETMKVLNAIIELKPVNNQDLP